MPSIVTRGGAEIYVNDWGVGHPLVLINGWPLSADSWDEYNYDTLSDDLADVTLKGLSMGGG